MKKINKCVILKNLIDVKHLFYGLKKDCDTFQDEYDYSNFDCQYLYTF